MTVSATIPSMSKNRILVIGGIGFMGQFITKASLAFGYPTFLLLRPGPISPSKAANVKTFQEKGAKIIHVSTASDYTNSFLSLLVDAWKL